jgi:heme A synthase
MNAVLLVVLLSLAISLGGLVVLLGGLDSRNTSSMTLTIRLLILAVGIGGAMILLMSCSADAIRNANTVDLKPMPRDAEREAIRERGIEFCKTYPDDIACKGPKR